MHRFTERDEASIEDTRRERDDPILSSAYLHSLSFWHSPKTSSIDPSRSFFRSCRETRVTRGTRALGLGLDSRLLGETHSSESSLAVSEGNLGSELLAGFLHGSDHLVDVSGVSSRGSLRERG